jgi:two-component system response regulator DesR
MREGIIALLSNEPDLAVVGICGDGDGDGDGDDVLTTAVEITPDVALIDIDLRTVDAFGVARALRRKVPRCAVMLTAARRRPDDLQRAAAAEVSGFLLKDCPAEVLANAIRRLARGERVIDADMVFAALNRRQNPLTRRELDVLRLLADGASTDQIAKTLVVTVGTVRNHLSRINNKIGARNRVQAIRIAEQSEWL